jgi:hypothetical protein
MARRFPPPWTVEDIGAAFVVQDSAGMRLAYCRGGIGARDDGGTVGARDDGGATCMGLRAGAVGCGGGSGVFIARRRTPAWRSHASSGLDRR